MLQFRGTFYLLNLLCFFLFSSSSSFAQSPQRSKAKANFRADRLIVKLKEGRQFPHLAWNYKIRHLFGQSYLLFSSHRQELETALRQHADIASVQKDYMSPKKQLAQGLKIFTPLLPQPQQEEVAGEDAIFNDPYISQIWSFRSSNENGLSVLRAYASTARDPRTQIVVAVVDTGIDETHEDLRDILWVNSDEIPQNGIDDDGNGYIDDINGINTLVRDEQQRPTPNVHDTNGHGTHVAGTIAAQQNNGIGIAGIASQVRIMAIRTVPNSGDETDSDVAESFIYAAKNGAKLINCSFGKDDNNSNVVQEAIDFIGKEYGVLVVAAAGNSFRDIDRYPTYPASLPNENLLVVAATSSGGEMAYFSNYGMRSVDIAVPGAAIYSTYPGQRYASLSGTSMASPGAVGVAAEILISYPQLGPLELKKILINSSVPVSQYQGKVLAAGRVDLERALIMAQQTYGLMGFGY